MKPDARPFCSSASHSFAWKWFIIDGTTLILLGILLVCPFIEQIRKIKIGEFEAEIEPGEVKKVKEEIDKSLGTQETKEAIRPETNTTRDDLLNLLDHDHILALAKLRIELESSLKRLYLSSVSDAKQQKQFGLNTFVNALVKSEVLPTEIAEPMREVISLCNRAIHGEYVRTEDARNIINIGIQALNYMDSKIEELIIKPIETEPIPPHEVQEFTNAKYRVTTIVPLVENPYRNVRVLDQEGLYKLLEGYGEYAEFLVSIERVDSVDNANQQNQ